MCELNINCNKLTQKLGREYFSWIKSLFFLFQCRSGLIFRFRIDKSISDKNLSYTAVEYFNLLLNNLENLSGSTKMIKKIQLNGYHKVMKMM